MTRATHDALGWARDAIQGRIIAEVFAQRVHGIVLKGGMAFRVRHPKWARATKDIDLDADADLSLDVLQRTVRQAIRKATMDGLLRDVKITEPKQTGTTARWKISGLYPKTDQVLHLTVEISRRESVLAEETSALPYEVSGVEGVVVYNDRSLAFRKVKALLAETREAPRDVSDLFLLIRANVDPPVAELRRWMAQGGKPRLEELWSKLERMDKSVFRSQVLPSLPPTPDGQILYEDWDKIRLEVGQNLESWLRLAGFDEASSPAPAPAGSPAP